MPLQPSSHHPFPPPDEAGRPLSKKTKRIQWIAGLLILLCLAVALILLPAMARQRRKADMTEARKNMRCVYCMLLEFDTEYGTYPSARTGVDVKEATGSELTFSSASSNQLLRQLMAGGGGKSEKPLWAKTATSPKKPDDIFNTDATALAKGECGFAYIAGLDASAAPATPVLLCPLVSGKLTFDPEPFNGQALILTNNGACFEHPIGKDGRVLINGMDVFDPRQAFWKGKKPDVKWPE